MIKRKTLASEFTISGVGLHTGEKVNLTCKPLLDGKGIFFKRTDIAESALIAADVSNVYDTNRSTNLKKDEVEVHTVEHVLSALMAKNIQDAIIELNGPEVPILDGSSIEIIDSINNAGTQEKEDAVEPFVINELIEFKHEESGASYTLLPSDQLELTVTIDFENTTIGKQYASLSDIGDYENEIAKAKTFVVLKDLEKLVQHNLAKGGSLENAIVFTNGQGNDQVQKMAKIFGIDQEMKIENGVIMGQGLKYSNEPARHKLLDLIGDLSLVGRPVQAKIYADKPGHASNVELAKFLKKKYLAERKTIGRPRYDPSQIPVKNSEEIKGLIPHRYPFLFIDKIMELSKTHVVGVKNLTVNELVFEGHFPGNPVFPGVLQMEAMAQTGGILAMNLVENPQEWDTYFIKMENVKFKNIVRPGDTLVFKLELLSPIRRGIVHMQGHAYVGDKLVSQGELIAQILKRT